LNIAIMGIRGIPANYGGFETFAEELAPRLAARGHSVTVYGRSHYISPRLHNSYYKGVRLLVLPAPRHKYLDTVCHTFLSACHALSQDFEVVFICNAANSPLALIPRLGGMKVALNVDGIERLRKKWNRLGRLYYRLGEFLATRLPHAIVADARVIQDYYRRTYGKASTMIPYGATVGRVDSREALDRFGVRPQEYLLYVSRLEPENNVHQVIQAFRQIRTEKKLVLVGDAPYSSQYKQQLYDLAKDDARIIFTGYVFGQGYKEFQSHAYAYIMAMEVGGTHPSLVEAMGFGNCVIVNGTPENIEVVGNAALIYQKNHLEDLITKIERTLADPAMVRAYQQQAQERVQQLYSWEAVTQAYENLFLGLIRPPGVKFSQVSSCLGQ
jgi:glycosyltransferase involved in cell wall biosynthesis